MQSMLVDPENGQNNRPIKTISSAKTRIVVLGSGFAAMSFVKAFTKHLPKETSESIDLVVVSKRNYHLFTPLLYQVATGLTDEHHLINPICKPHQKFDYRTIETEVKSIDTGIRTVNTSAGSLSYDYLLIALGSVASDFGIKGVQENAMTLKSLQDAERIRNRIIESFERSTLLSADQSERKASLTFVVVGGGATGVELAGSIVDFAHLLSKRYYGLRTNEVKVVLVEAFDSLLPGSNQILSSKSRTILESAGVEIKVKTLVVEVKPGSVMLSDGSEIDTSNVFWTAGTKPNPAVTLLPENIAVKKKGRIVADKFLGAKNFSNVYVIGDDAWITQGSESLPVPLTAAAAVKEGAYVGKLLSYTLAHKRQIKQFVYNNEGMMLSLGRFRGVAQFSNGIIISGFLGWVIWRMVHLVKISTVRNKLGVMLDWGLSLLHRRIVSRTD